MKSILSLITAIVFCTVGQAQRVKPGLNLTMGEVYTQKTVSDIDINETINGQPFIMKMSVDGTMTYKVIAVENSTYDLEVEYKNLTMTMQLPNGTVEFSSEKDDESDIFSTILGSLKDKPFRVKMTDKGKITEVTNIDSLFAHMFDEFPQLSADQRQQVQDQVKKAYGEKAFKGNIEMTTAIFPDGKVSEGDHWTIKTKLEAGMAAKMVSDYELKEINDSTYNILGNSTIETADKDAYIETNGMPMRYDLSGTMTSDIIVDRKSGWIITATINQSLKGSAFIKDNPKIPGGMEIPMTMTNAMTMSDK